MDNKQATEWTHEYAEGWDNLVDTLVSNLYAIDPNLHIAQIKQKFGGLRAYIDHSIDLSEEKANRFEELITKAEEESYTICERCGGTGKTISIQGWYRTLCEEDEAKIIAERKADRERSKLEEERRNLENEALKTSTICMECGNEGIWREDIRVKTTVLCEEHYKQWQEMIAERRKKTEAIRAEILSQKNL